VFDIEPGPGEEFDAISSVDVPALDFFVATGLQIIIGFRSESGLKRLRLDGE
jgi:hypothetical protein